MSDIDTPASAEAKPCSTPHSAPASWLALGRDANSKALPLDGGGLGGGDASGHGADFIDITPQQPLPIQRRGISAEDRAEAIRYHMEALEDLADASSRPDGWTPFARRLFLDVLSETGRVTLACNTAGLTKQSAYSLRARDPLFAAGWDAACELARMPLADALYERAMEGVTETITRKGEVVAERHRHDNRLSIAVLHRLDKRCDRAAETGARHLGAVARWDDFIRAISQDDEAAAQTILSAGPIMDAGPEENSPHGQPSQLPLVESDEDPAPDEYEERIWWDEIEEEWRTDYPVPPHYIGSSRGKFGDSDYSRTLTADEQNLVEAEEAAALADEAAEDFHPPRPLLRRTGWACGNLSAGGGRGPGARRARRFGAGIAALRLR